MSAFHKSATSVPRHFQQINRLLVNSGNVFSAYVFQKQGMISIWFPKIMGYFRQQLIIGYPHIYCGFIFDILYHEHSYKLYTFCLCVISFACLNKIISRTLINAIQDLVNILVNIFCPLQNILLYTQSNFSNYLKFFITSHFFRVSRIIC